MASMVINFHFSFLIILFQELSFPFIMVWPIINCYLLYRSLHLCILQLFTVFGVQFCLRRNLNDFWNPRGYVEEVFLGRENGKCKGSGVGAQQEGW